MITNRKLITGLLLSMLVLAILVSGCTSTVNPTPSPADKPVTKTSITIFAAASLKDAFNETKARYEAQHKGVNIILNFDGSQALRAQIEQGAHADIFASASTSHMNALKDQGYMNNSTVTSFANNKLAIIVPKDNPAGIHNISDLAESGVKIVIGTKDVPVGDYTLQILGKISNNTTYGSDYYRKVMDNVVSQETTVNFVTSKVALGEADAGIVYVSDVPEEYKDKVSVITIPDEFNVIAVYPIGVLNGSGNPTMAEDFINYVKSPKGGQILSKYGFTPV